MDDPEDVAMGIFVQALVEIRQRGIETKDLLTPLVDLTAMVALTADGEKCLRAVIKRLRSRIDDYRAGTFPLDASHDTVQ
jgi:hypothetical protein